jgi:glycosyltransferase involved in cell wall biosynthesis
VLFASADYEASSWVNAQHLAVRLARRHRVLYVNSLGLRLPRATRGDFRKVARRLAPLRRAAIARPDPARELFVLTPHPLPPARGGLWRAVRAALLARQLRAAIERLGLRRPIAWVFLPTATGVVARCRLAPVIYHCVDAYEANPGVDVEMIRREEDDLLARAAVVIASSQPLFERLRARHPAVRLMPNVADLGAYPPPGSPPPAPPDLAAIPRPRVGYVGNLAAYKCDLALLARAARARPDLSWVFVGAIGHGEASTPLGELRRLPNAHFLGEKPRGELAAYIHHLDAGLIPFVANETTRHSFPMKFFEYLACGVPVVSAQLPALAEHLTPPLAFACRDDDAFGGAIDAALAARGGETARRRRALAEAHSWERRMEEVEALLAELAATRDR